MANPPLTGLHGRFRPKVYILSKLSSKLIEAWGYCMRETRVIKVESQVPVFEQTRYIVRL